MTYAAQHTLPLGMHPVPQEVVPISQAARMSRAAGLGDTSTMDSRRSMASPPRRARAVISPRRILVLGPLSGN